MPANNRPNRGGDAATKRELKTILEHYENLNLIDNSDVHGLNLTITGDRKEPNDVVRPGGGKMTRKELDERFQRLEDLIITNHIQTSHRFDRLEAKVDEIDRRLTVVEHKVDEIDRRLTVVEAKVDEIDRRLTVVEKKVDEIDRRLTVVEFKVDKIDQRLTVVEDILHRNNLH